MLTQAQIAQKLGLSRQLVTFALAGYPQVSQESRGHVLATAPAQSFRICGLAAVKALKAIGFQGARYVASFGLPRRSTAANRSLWKLESRGDDEPPLEVLLKTIAPF